MFLDVNMLLNLYKPMFSLLTFFIDLKLFLKQFVENIEFFNTGSFGINLKSFISKYILGQLKPTHQ